MMDIIFLFFLAFIGVPSYAFPLIDYPLNWSNIGSVTSQRNLNSPRLGFCVCDRTRGLCDPNCCCDPDCSQSSMDFFTSCLPQQYGYPPFRICSGESFEVDGKTLKLKDDGQIPGIGGPMCMIKENVPNNIFPYFTVPSKVEFSKAKHIFVEENHSLKVGSLIGLVKYVDRGNTKTFKYFTPLSIPTQNGNGGCIFPGLPIPFMNPIQKSSCTLNGEQICKEIPIEQFLNLYVDGSTYFAPINIYLYDSAGTLIESIIAPNSSRTVSTFNGSICENAVTVVRGTLQYNESLITGGRYDITIADISSTQYVPISVQVFFTASGQITPLNIISGTPGYGIGTRLRAGVKESAYDRVGIAERESGLGIPGGGRNCHLNNFKTVRLGYDVINSGCFVYFSELELQNLCSVGTESYIRDILGVSQTSKTIFVAKTNDALASDPPSWVEIDGLNTTNTAGVYDEIRRRCDNIAVGVKYNVVTASAGVVFNPQTIIVGVFAEFLRGSLAIRNSTDLSNGGTSPQYFTFKVSFLEY